jgi:hypothetical protein
LLISHFGAKDDEAVRLWETAGYGMDKIPASQMNNSDQVVPLISAAENKVLFTDIVDIMVNNYGVVMNFMQAGPGNSTHSVARLGMSREHAKSILKILQHTLSQTEQPGKIVSPENNQNTKN